MIIKMKYLHVNVNIPVWCVDNVVLLPERYTDLVGSGSRDGCEVCAE